MSCILSDHIIVNTSGRLNIFASEVRLHKGSLWHVYGNSYQLRGYTTKCLGVGLGLLLVTRVKKRSCIWSKREQGQPETYWVPPLGWTGMMSNHNLLWRMVTSASHQSSELYRDTSWLHRRGSAGKGSS